MFKLIRFKDGGVSSIYNIAVFEKKPKENFKMLWKKKNENTSNSFS